MIVVFLKQNTQVNVWLKFLFFFRSKKYHLNIKDNTRMWAIVQRDGRPAEYLSIGGALSSTPQSLADAHY